MELKIIRKPELAVRLAPDDHHFSDRFIPLQGLAS